MSDTVTLQLPENTPLFLSRLRPGLFTSPSGVESSFLFDDLSRTRSKKSSAHEIADSNTTIGQDLGASLHVFPMAIYFVGDNCDLDADKFYGSLFERYTPDAPGVLNHPRWGDRNVIPFGDIGQAETYTTGGGISRITVEFRETASVKANQTDVKTESEIKKNYEAAKLNALERAGKAIGTAKGEYAKFKGSILSKVALVKGAIDSVTGLADDIRAEVDSIHQGILDAITLASAPAEVLAQVDALIESVMSIPQDTVNLASSIFDMTESVIDSFGTDLSGAKNADEVKQLAASYQSVALACVAGSALSSLAVDYTTRDQAGASIDSIVSNHDAFTAQLSAFVSSANGSVSNTFIPDTDASSLLHGIAYDSASILLSRSFSLKSRRQYTLTTPSDPMTETWTRYGDLSQLEFFCSTNGIGGNEFIELPAGRVIVAYE